MVGAHISCELRRLKAQLKIMRIQVVRLDKLHYFPIKTVLLKRRDCGIMGNISEDMLSLALPKPNHLTYLVRFEIRIPTEEVLSRLAEINLVPASALHLCSVRIENPNKFRCNFLVALGTRIVGEGQQILIPYLGRKHFRRFVFLHPFDSVWNPKTCFVCTSRY